MMITLCAMHSTIYTWPCKLWMHLNTVLYGLRIFKKFFLCVTRNSVNSSFFLTLDYYVKICIHKKQVTSKTSIDIDCIQPCTGFSIEGWQIILCLTLLKVYLICEYLVYMQMNMYVCMCVNTFTYSNIWRSKVDIRWFPQSW